MTVPRTATAMGFYVDLDVDEMADELWANHHPADVTTGPLATTGRKAGEEIRKPDRRKGLSGFRLRQGG